MTTTRTIAFGSRSFWLLGLCLLGCGDDTQDPSPTPDPLAVTAVSPADAAADVETGVPLTAAFNRDVIGATVTAETFVLRAGGSPLPTAVTYDAGSRTARLVGPLLPATLYQAELTTGITDDEGEPLSDAEEWSFTTRAWQAGTVDQLSGEGSAISLAVDGSGRLHAVYWDGAGEDLRYATCESECATAANWTAITVDEDGNVGQSASLAIDPDGGLHVIYADIDNLDVRYATCTAACTTPASWTAATVDSVGNVTGFGSLTADDGGRLHAAYFDLTNFNLKYSTCEAECATPEAWTSALLGDLGPGAQKAVIAVDGTGRVHTAWPRAFNTTLAYATCGAGCTTAANWSEITVDEGAGSTPSMALDGSNGVHLSYYDNSNGDLTYATCAAQCGTVTNWSSLSVDQPGNVGLYTSLARDGYGRLHVVYRDLDNDDLKYATCAGVCTAAASWRSVAVDQAGDVGTWASAALDGSGRLHVVYRGETDVDLRYIR